MTNHPNRNWRRKWYFDEEQQALVHQSGVWIKVDQFSNLYIYALGLNNHLLEHVTLDKARTLARLLKEANELWSEQNGTD